MSAPLEGRVLVFGLHPQRQHRQRCRQQHQHGEVRLDEGGLQQPPQAAPRSQLFPALAPLLLVLPLFRLPLALALALAPPLFHLAGRQALGPVCRLRPSLRLPLLRRLLLRLRPAVARGCAAAAPAPAGFLHGGLEDEAAQPQADVCRVGLNAQRLQVVRLHGGRVVRGVRQAPVPPRELGVELCLGHLITLQAGEHVVLGHKVEEGATDECGPRLGGAHLAATQASNALVHRAGLGDEANVVGGQQRVHAAPHPLLHHPRARAVRLVLLLELGQQHAVRGQRLRVRAPAQQGRVPLPHRLHHPPQPHQPRHLRGRHASLVQKRLEAVRQARPHYGPQQGGDLEEGEVHGAVLQLPRPRLVRRLDLGPQLPRALNSCRMLLRSLSPLRHSLHHREGARVGRSPRATGPGAPP